MLYTVHAKYHEGLDPNRFSQLISTLFHIENHPFIREMFMFFDMWTCDGIIDFREFVVGLDVIERGTFEENVKYCFAKLMSVVDSFILIFSFSTLFNGIPKILN